MQYKVILFDIDGTLCDPGSSITESAKHALSEFGIIETDEAALRRFVGPPLEHSFKDYYKFTDSDAAKAAIIFRKKLQTDGIKLYKTYDGIPDLLKKIADENKTLAIVTSKVDYVALEALEKTGIVKYFDVIGAQSPNEVVEKEVVLSRVLTRLNISDKSKAVMIGDRKHDIEAANSCGIDSIGVLWGYGSEEEFNNEGATYQVHDATELSNILTD